MTYYLAIDIGASSGRHILGWREGDRFRTEEIYRFENGAVLTRGRLVWNTARLFREILCGLKRAKELGKVPSFVGIDTWGVDYVLLDGNGEQLGQAYCYRDGRTESAVSHVHRLIPFEELYARTGIQFQPFNTIYQILADRLVHRRLGRARSLLMLPDYFNYLLTGVKRQEYTNATTTGLVNAFTHTWDSGILKRLGLSSRFFGGLSQPGTAVGPFKDSVREEVGYTAQVILPASHDTASAVIAAPLSGQTPYLSSGTWSLLGIEQDAARTGEDARKSDYSNEGSLNFTFRFQKNIMGLWMLQRLRREMGEGIGFSHLADLARSKEPIGTVNVNDSRFLAPFSMSEEIDDAMGMRLGAASRARVIYDSLAASYASSVADLEQIVGKRFSTLHIIGGGSQDVFLNTLTAKATGKKIVAGPVEATAIGNLAVQMIGTGEIGSVAEARLLIKNSFETKEIL